MDEVSQSPSRAENIGGSLTLSTSSPRAVSGVLMPGLENIQVGPSLTATSLLMLYMACRCSFVHRAPLLHPQPLASPSGPLALDSPQVLDSPLLPPLASPTRARSPDVISSASTAMSQDMPEIASQTLQLQRGLVSSLEPLPLSALQTDSMASAASALHLLTSPRTANNGYVDVEHRSEAVGKVFTSASCLLNEPALNIHQEFKA